MTTIGPHPQRVAALVLVLLAAAFGLAGCGDDDDDEADESEETATAEALTGEASPPSSGDGAWWVPAPDVTWQWQLSGEVNTSYDVEVYDIDLFDSDAELIAALQAEGRRVICYFSAGSAEDWRPDYSDFADEDVGEPLGDWEGERWVDIRSAGVRAIMLARLDLAIAKGCDGVEPDNVQSYDDDTGFDLDADDQLEFNRLIASAAHERGLAVGLKNGGGQAAELVDAYDFALNEECHEYEECEDFAPFLEAGKAVLNVEYRDSEGDARELAKDVCPRADALGLRTLILPLELDDTFRVACFEED